MVFQQVCAGSDVDVAALPGNRQVRAHVLRSLCADKLDPAPDRVVLSNAQVAQRLNLADTCLNRALKFKDCTFPQGVDLSSAASEATIEFEGCVIRDFCAPRLKSKQDVSLIGCQTVADLKSADIEGNLRLSGSQFDRPDGVALNCSDMRVKGAVYLDQGCRVSGKLSLASTHIERDMDCRGGQFQNRSATAIDATHLIVDGELVCEDGFSADGEVGLRWAQVRAVRLRGATVSNPAGFAVAADGLRVSTGVFMDDGFRADGEVSFAGARIGGELRCTDGRFDNRSGVAIDASRVVAEDIYLDQGFWADGEVRVVGAKLGRQFNCSGGRFDNPGAFAVDAHGLDCAGAVYLDAEFCARGQVRLVGATVTEGIVCTDGLFENPGGDALDADGMATDGHILLDGKFRAIGGVRLARVAVGRELSCSGGTFERIGGIALDLTGLVGHGDVQLDCGFRAVGEVRAWGAAVARDMSLLMAHLGNCGGTAFDAHGLQAGGNLIWRLAGKPEGGIDLSFAEIARLKDDKTSWPTEHINLNGFTYRSIDSDLSVEDRIDILKRADYAYQPYQHLAGIYRGAGRDPDARKVVMARENDRTRRGHLKWHSKIWNYFLRGTVGYGYRLWLPFVVVLALGFANGFVYHAAEHGQLIETTTGNGPSTHGRAICPNNTPCFNPWAYSYQLLIPGVNLQQVDKYSPDARKEWGTLLAVYTWLMVVLGWVFGTGLVAGLNRVFREKR